MSSQNKNNLESQATRLVTYAQAKGYRIIHIVKEIGSGVNDQIPKLLRLLQEDDYGTLIVERKDHLTKRLK